VMWNTDLRRYGPNAYISSIMVDFKAFYVEQVRRRLAGEWTPTHDLLTFGNGVDVDTWGETVPADVAAKADAVKASILDGSFNPFVGEIKDTKGNIKVASGQTMTEQELYHWSWSIEGVSGLDT